MVFPRWFNALPDGEGHYFGYYCQSCVKQGSNLNQCKSQYYCIDCAVSNLCQSCFMTFGTHTRHDKVQVYKATFRDAVREADIKKRLGSSYQCIISKLQPYIFNGKNIYFLAPPRECKQAYKNLCLTCRRKETLGEQHEYCSIKCVRDAPQITTMHYDNTKASHNARQHDLQALPQRPKSKSNLSAHPNKFGQLVQPRCEAMLEENNLEIVGAQTNNYEESERHHVQQGLRLMEIISNVANGVIESRKRSINDHTKHVECQLSKDGSKHLDGKVVIRDFLQTLKVCVKNASKLHDVSNHEDPTSSLGIGQNEDGYHRTPPPPCYPITCNGNVEAQSDEIMNVDNRLSFQPQQQHKALNEQTIKESEGHDNTQALACISHMMLEDLRNKKRHIDAKSRCQRSKPKTCSCHKIG
jgi:hypothetical protein